MTTRAGNPLFGDWSRYPRGEGAVYVTAPVGEPCAICAEPIAAFDAGELIPCLDPDGFALRPQHRECIMLGIIGHDFGVCGCTNYAGATSRRAAGRELERRMIELGPPGRRGRT